MFKDYEAIFSKFKQKFYVDATFNLFSWCNHKLLHTHTHMLTKSSSKQYLIECNNVSQHIALLRLCNVIQSFFGMLHK